MKRTINSKNYAEKTKPGNKVTNSVFFVSTTRPLRFFFFYHNHKVLQHTNNFAVARFFGDKICFLNLKHSYHTEFPFLIGNDCQIWFQKSKWPRAKEHVVDGDSALHIWFDDSCADVTRIVRRSMVSSKLNFK